MDTLLQDLRFAARALLRSPGFAAVAILTLALGIGANTAIFSFVDALLLRPLPYEASDRLVMVWQDEQRRGGPEDEWTSPPNFLDWRAQNQVFDDLAAFTGAAATLTGEGEAERLAGAQVSSGFFSILGVRPIAGRDFVMDDEAPGAERVVLLSHGLWQRRFGGDLDVVDTAIDLNGNPATVIGVLPPGFRFPYLPAAEYWAPLADPANICGRRCIFLRVVGRLRPGVTIERARSEMSTIARRLEAEYPAANTGVDIAVTSLHEEVAGPFRPALLMLLGAVGFLLLIACANVANLLLAQAARREGELAVRTALGASRHRLARQLLTESLLLAAIGGGIGAILGSWGVDLLVAMVPAGPPRIDEVGLDLRVLGFTAAVTVLTGVVFGLAPALQAAKRDINASIREAGRGAHASRRTRRLRGALVVAEISLALVLLTGAGLLARSFVRLRGVDLGFRTENVITARIALPSARYEAAAIGPFFDRLIERLGALPGVRAAAGVSTLPLGGNINDTGFRIEGQPEPSPEEVPITMVYDVTPDYFRLMDLPVRRGRAFTAYDREGAPPVVIIDEMLARRYFPGEDPIGKRVVVRGGVTREIVGVADEVRHFGPQRDARPAMYFPHAQIGSSALDLVLRTDGDPLRVSGTLRATIRALDPNLAASGISTLDELAADAMAQPRLYSLLLALFATVALMLASFGIYGVISYSVAQRTNELGLRMALGADRGAVLRLVVRQGLIWTGLGLAIGCIAALALGRLITSLLFGVGPGDPLTFAGVALLLTGVALLACWIPARRAARVDPMVALRAE